MNSLPVNKYEGYYQVFEDGTVHSLPRSVNGRDGVTYPVKGKTLSPTINKKLGYKQVSLWKNNKGTWLYVHRLVAEAFIPNPDNKPEVNHIDGDKLNNHVNNLEWVTSKGNSIHAVQTGLRIYTNRLTKSEFIECLQDVIKGESYASVANRVPYQVPYLSVKLRQLAKELGQEDLLDASLLTQKQQRARINGNPHNR